MSYCRMGQDSDVYMYPHINGYIVCVNCKLSERPYDDEMQFKTQKQAIAHLEHHIASGNKVPKYAIEILKKELGDKK